MTIDLQRLWYAIIPYIYSRSHHKENLNLFKWFAKVVYLSNTMIRFDNSLFNCSLIEHRISESEAHMLYKHVNEQIDSLVLERGRLDKLEYVT